MPHVEVGEYRDHPVITLKRAEGDQYGFTFGKLKARLALKHRDVIELFSKGETADIDALRDAGYTDPCITVEEYHGHPTLQLKERESDRYGFTFGVKKAELIQECWVNITAFIETADEELMP